jgi:1-aminocyclopropane-1-carboxylate deaminase
MNTPQELNLPSPVQKVQFEPFLRTGIDVYMKRDDLIHFEIQGNKWRKLKYNLEEFLQKGDEVLATFGGAFSNHIAATAAAGKLYGIKTLGIIRGVYGNEISGTLSGAERNGMQLEFIHSSEWKNRFHQEFADNLSKKYGKVFFVPDGGANSQGRKGAMEILQEVEEHFHVVITAAGTGTTASGILMSLPDETELYVVKVVKDESLETQVCNNLESDGFFDKSLFNRLKWVEGALNGYGKKNTDLEQFILEFYNQSGIPLDPVYTGKMMLRLHQLVQNNQFEKGSKVLAIHSGGLQGWKGYFSRFSPPNLQEMLTYS